MAKQLLFSLTKKDFEIDTFCSGGKGGQHQNKTESGIRITHPASGAVGECRETRSQHQNKLIAFRRMLATEKFKKWHKMECAKRLGTLRNAEDEVKKAMRDENIKTEIHDENGKWIAVNQSALSDKEE